MQFSSFIQQYRNKLRFLFREQENANRLNLEKGINPDAYKQIMDCKPLSVFIPTKYNGRGVKTHEALAMLEASSYESLPLSLMMGINGALFLQPVVNYGQDCVKENIFKRFIEQNNMGGLMITEPDYGSDALHMQTNFIKEGAKYNVTGTKHWQGLTGRADYWLIAARKRSSKGNLDRDISFFIHDSQNGGIEVEEYYRNLGLHLITYGLNQIDITVGEDHKLEPRSIGIKMMLDILHRSRLQFPGMGMGFLKRMLDDAHKHCKQRHVGGRSLYQYDQVRKRITDLQSAFTICSAMCAFTSEHIPIERDVSSATISANTIKSVTTDLMQSASQSFLQLMGAKGYRLDHLAGRAIIDSRPFQIFEGPNDILYQQISEGIIKLMKKLKLTNLYEFLNNFRLTEEAAGYVKETLDFELEMSLAQHKLVELGQALSRVISLQFTLKLGENGFNQKLIHSTVETLTADVHRLMGGFKNHHDGKVIDEYEESSSWLQAFTPVLA